MSDMMNENNQPMQGSQLENQPTRVIPAVDASAAGAAPRPQRHRRSERYQEDAPAMPIAPPVQPMPPMQQEPEQRAQESTIRVQAFHQPQQNVPQPAALRNRPVRPEGNVSRPLDVPGYTPRQPLGTGPVQQPMPRQPYSAMEGSGRRPVQQQPVQPEKKRGHGLLVTLVIIVLLLGLLVLGFLMIDEKSEGFLGDAKRGVLGLLGREASVTESLPAATASGFTAAINSGTAPLDVIFNLTTSKTVTQVRLVDEVNMPLNAVASPVTENADAIIWMINLAVTDGYEGLVRAQIYDGAAWLDTGMAQTLNIAKPVPSATVDAAVFSEATDAPTQAPTQAPTDVPTEAPTQAPTEAPTDVPTPTPTLAITATPTLEPTATPAPTEIPTEVPTEVPTEAPTAEPVIATQVPVVTEAPTEAPTATPTAAPTEAPTATPAPTFTPEPTAPMTVEAADEADPSLIANTVIYNKKTVVEDYTREKALNMPAEDAYTTLPYGVMTFRGNAFRQNAAVGNVSAEEFSAMSVAWTVEAGSVKGSGSTYYGIGWTGQPAIIKWSKEVRLASNIKDEKKAVSALKEVIVAGLDGNIYFLDLATGDATRNVIKLGYPMRGTPSLHSLGFPVMAVGQYARKMASGTGDIGLRVYNLLNQKQVYWIDGLDGKDNRPYNEVGAFDTSALIDPSSDTLVAIGTNGMLYTADLNTEYDAVKQTVSIDPELVSMKSRTKNQKAAYTAVESSPAMYGSYVFYADMDGILRCVDTTTMTTVWAVDTDDAAQAAIALDTDEQGNVWLYTANVLENRKKGDSTIRRFNAATGEEDWSLAVNVATSAVKKAKDKTPGAMASPVVGQYGLNDLVYFTLTNVSKTGAATLVDGADAAMAGVLVAMDKQSGDIVWTHELDSYGYSSPVAVYNKAGKGWIIQASASGMMTLLDGETGEVVNTLQLNGTIEGSPAVYNDMLVIGTTGKNTSFIYGVKLQ